MGMWPAKLKYELTFHWDCLSCFLEKHLHAGLICSALSFAVACPVGDRGGSLIWLHTLSFLPTRRQAKSQQERAAKYVSCWNTSSLRIFPGIVAFLFSCTVFSWCWTLPINLISLRTVKNRTLMWVAGFIYLPLKLGKFSKHRKCIRRTNHYTEEFGKRMVTFFPAASPAMQTLRSNSRAVFSQAWKKTERRCVYPSLLVESTSFLCSLQQWKGNREMPWAMPYWAVGEAEQAGGERAEVHLLEKLIRIW